MAAKTDVFISGVALCGALGAKDEEGMMQGNVNSLIPTMRTMLTLPWLLGYWSKKVYNKQSQHASFIPLKEHRNDVKISQTSLALGVF